MSECADGPATECERWARCGKALLNDSRRSSFGFCELVLSGGQYGRPSTRAFTATRDARTSQHAAARAQPAAWASNQRGQTHRLRNIAGRLDGAAQEAAAAHGERRGEDEGTVRSKSERWGALMKW